jgi:hypothetical protein
MDDINETIPFNRDVMMTVLIYHQRKDISVCGCGWSKLGHSHAKHVVEVYEMSMIRR